MALSPGEANPLPRIEGVKQPEIPQVKSEVNKPPDKLGTQNALDELNKTTPGIPDRPDLKNLAQAGEIPFQQFLDQEATTDRTPMVGGELITPTAVRVDDERNPDGTLNVRTAQERGWLAAITSANGKELPVDQRKANIQAIVNAAKQAGVSPDVLRFHIQNLGLSAVTAEQQATQTPVNTSRSDENGKTPQQGNTTESTTQTDENKVDPISQGFVDRIKTIGTAAHNDQQNVDLANQLQEVLAEAVNAGVPRDQIRTQLTEMGFNVIKKDESQQGTGQQAKLEATPPSAQKSEAQAGDSIQAEQKPTSATPTSFDQLNDPNLSPQEKKALEVKLKLEAATGGVGIAIAERAIQDKILKALSINTATPEEIQAKQAFIQEQVELAKQRGIPAETIQSWFENTGVDVTKRT